MGDVGRYTRLEELATYQIDAIRIWLECSCLVIDRQQRNW